MTPLSTAEKEALLARLEAMRIEPEGADRTFVARLVEENCWTPAYAERVLKEYGRFLFLAVSAGHAVTPSDEVDQAWHLHLAYSRHYWEELCGRILRHPLHHGPTAGGRAEASRYRTQYAETLTSYRAAFGAGPPADIWPAERERFAARYQRVDRRRHWIMPKLPWRAAVAAMLVAGCALGSDATDGSKTATFIAFSMIGLVIVALIYTAHRRSRGEQSGCGSGAGGCGGGGSGGSSKGDENGCGSDGGGGCGSSGCGGGGCGS